MMEIVCLLVHKISSNRSLTAKRNAAGRYCPCKRDEDATNGFDVSTFIGKGSIGKVYKGKLTNGTDIAIRYLCLYGKHSTQRLKFRLDQLSKLRHPHLVTLLGHFLDGYSQDQSSASRIFLVYEYVPNGSFHSHLSDSSPQRLLAWSDRLAILIDIAKAVHFLHTGVVTGSLHNRLRTKNILLDENGVAKLSDYGITAITEDIEMPEGKGDSSKSRYVYSLLAVMLEFLLFCSHLVKT